MKSFKQFLTERENPNTNSKGQVIHPTEEGVRNFWRWFGPSHAVDGSNRPLVLYHGTAQDFDEFSEYERGRNTGSADSELGFFFTDNPDVAGDYAEEGRRSYRFPVSMPVYLSIMNPLVRDMRNEGYDGEQFVEIINAARWSGHDGVIFKNVYDGVGHERVGTTYVVFRPSQIKSAISNNGKYSHGGNITESR